MNMNLHVHTKGNLACFTRPEMKVERVNHPVLTAGAAGFGGGFGKRTMSRQRVRHSKQSPPFNLAV